MKKTISFFLAVILAFPIKACAFADGAGFQKDKVTFSGLTVVDNEECAIQITGIQRAYDGGCELKIAMENKSGDKTYRFSIRNASVNGVQCDTMFSNEVSAGKKAIDTAHFYGNGLDMADVDYSNIEVTFKVYDSDKWSDTIALETVHIYPYGEDAATTFEFQQKDSDIVIVDNDYVTAIVVGFDPDNTWGYTVNLFLRNKAKTETMFSVDEASINGYMSDPFWAESIQAGKCGFESLHWYDSKLQELGIDEVEEIEFIFKAYDNENWFAEKYFNDPVTLNP